MFQDIYSITKDIGTCEGEMSMDTKVIYKKCHEIVKDPVKYITEEKRKTGKKYIGYTCIFPSEEILHAAGYIPIRIMGFSKKLINSERYITSNCCEFARSIVEFLSSKDAEILDGFLFSHCCDTLQVTADIASDIMEKEIFIYNIPTNLDSKYSKNYIESAICDFKLSVENKLDIKIDVEQIEKSYYIYLENRKLLSRLSEIRSSKPGIISGYDSLAVMIAGLFMPKEEHNELLKDLLDSLEVEEYKKTNKKKILVSGIINCNLDLINIIEESGAIVIEDDLCEASRVLPFHYEEKFKFPHTLASVTSNLFCPVKNYQNISYEKVLLDKINRSKCDGTIFIYFPFCDPQFLEYVYVKKRFQEKDIKSLLVEIVVNSNNFAQLQTRIEAFLESI